MEKFLGKTKKKIRRNFLKQLNNKLEKVKSMHLKTFYIIHSCTNARKGITRAILEDIHERILAWNSSEPLGKILEKSLEEFLVESLDWFLVKSFEKFQEKFRICFEKSMEVTNCFERAECLEGFFFLKILVIQEKL